MPSKSKSFANRTNSS